MTDNEILRKIVAKQAELNAIKKEWDDINLQANAIQGRSEKIVYELTQLLNEAKNVVGDITPDAIIEGENDGK